MGETTTESREQKQVLEMLSEGKISVEDAHKLLDKLRMVAGQPRDSEGGTRAGGERASGAGTGGSRPRFLRIQATGEDEEDHVNLRIPLGMAQAGLTLNSYLPSWVNRHVFVGGVDLAKALDLESEDLRDHLEDLDLVVDTKNGETVRIFCE